MVTDACFFEQPREEAEIGLAVLDAVLEPRKRARVELHHGLDLPVREDLLRDVGDREVLEDAIVAPLRGAPERGDDPQEVRGEPIGLDLDLLGELDDAGPGEPTGDLERSAVADDGVEIEVFVGRTSDEGDVEEGRHLLHDREAPHGEVDVLRCETKL